MRRIAVHACLFGLGIGRPALVWFLLPIVFVSARVLTVTAPIASYQHRRRIYAYLQKAVPFSQLALPRGLGNLAPLRA